MPAGPARRLRDQADRLVVADGGRLPVGPTGQDVARDPLRQGRPRAGPRPTASERSRTVTSRKPSSSRPSTRLYAPPPRAGRRRAWRSRSSAGPRGLRLDPAHGVGLLAAVDLLPVLSPVHGFSPFPAHCPSGAAAIRTRAPEDDQPSPADRRDVANGLRAVKRMRFLARDDGERRFEGACAYALPLNITTLRIVTSILAHQADSRPPHVAPSIRCATFAARQLWRPRSCWRHRTVLVPGRLAA